jgi:choice-of-anchor B domain-containing protein
VLNEDMGYAYAVGTNTFSGGTHFVNIQDPLNPTPAGGFATDGYTHDAQVVTYNGPDTDYTGREILISSSGSEQVVSIVDVTDKNNPVGISTLSYANVGYTHQGWFTEDQRYFLLGDEFDESNVGFNTRTVVFDLSDLDNPQQDFEYFGATSAIDHNGYVKGNRYFLANYAAGFREIDISDISNGNMTEVGYFDTYPADNNASYSGAWNVYPYFDSGNILITDRSGGFFLVKSSSLGVNDFSTATNFAVFPNPASNRINIETANDIILKITISDMLGNILYAEENINTEEKEIDISIYSQGIYILTINDNITKKIIKK